MDMVPAESKWHSLPKEIVYGFAHELDFYSCNSLRQTCKQYHKIINNEYWKQKFERIWLAAKHMDVDLYTKNMIFFGTQSAWGYAWRLYDSTSTSDKNREETEAIRFLAYRFNEGLWQESNRLYDHSHREKLFKAYAGDFQRNKRDYETPRYYFGGLQIIRLILHQTGNVNFQNEDGNTLLHCAKRKEQYEYLLKKPGVNVNIRNNKGETPLHYAIANPTSTYYKGPLDICAGIDKWFLAEALLKDIRIDSKAITNKQKTVFHYAAKYGSNRTKGFGYLTAEFTGLHILKLLIELLYIDDLIAVDNKGRNALGLAVRHGHIDAVKILFPLYPDDMKCMKDKSGKTLLHLAVQNKYYDMEMIQFLLPHFSQEEQCFRDQYDKTFLDYMRREDRLSLISENPYFLEEEQCFRKKQEQNKKDDLPAIVPLAYVCDTYLGALILGYKKTLGLGLLATIATYFYMKK